MKKAAKTLPKEVETITVTKLKPVEEFTGLKTLEAQELVDLIDNTELHDEKNYIWASKALYQVAQQHDQIDNKRKEWTENLRKVVDDINATFKPVTTLLKKAEKSLKDKLGAYAIAFETPKLETASVTVEWDGEVVDESLIPTEFWIVTRTVNVEGLRALTVANLGQVKIPGWAPKKVATVRTNRK